LLAKSPLELIQIMSYRNLSAQLEAIVYLAKEPVSLDDILAALPEVDAIEIERTLNELIERYRTEHHGIEIREVAGGYRFSTKPEHHEVLKQFIKTQIPPTRLSLAGLETLAVMAYKPPVTDPEEPCACRYCFTPARRRNNSSRTSHCERSPNDGTGLEGRSRRGCHQGRWENSPGAATPHLYPAE